jgi:hypothetical protein
MRLRPPLGFNLSEKIVSVVGCDADSDWASW